MANQSFACTNARNVIINAYKNVKKERKDRVKNWKKALDEIINRTNIEMKALNKKIQSLHRLQKTGEDVAAEIEKADEELDKLDHKARKLEQIRDNDELKLARTAIFQDIMDTEEANICPFCGADLGSASGVAAHLAEKNDGPSSEELKNMNSVVERDNAAYASNYKAAHGNPKESQTKVDIEGLGEFDVPLVDAVHHLIPVDVYSGMLRVSRLGTLAGFDVNQASNLRGYPTIKFKDFANSNVAMLEKIVEKEGKTYANMTDEHKESLCMNIMDKIQKQLHIGPHSYVSKDGESYEKKALTKLAEMQMDVLDMSKNGCLGQTADGRKQVGDFMSKSLTKIEQEIEAGIEDFSIPLTQTAAKMSKTS